MLVTALLSNDRWLSTSTYRPLAVRKRITYRKREYAELLGRSTLQVPPGASTASPPTLCNTQFHDIRLASVNLLYLIIAACLGVKTSFAGGYTASSYHACLLHRNVWLMRSTDVGQQGTKRCMQRAHLKVLHE